ncbi:winged helix-turn-helix transcriptional regulator [Candidatus Chloroploca sp. M-50]|uniref:Winged helix-turn-helix transcriptional regulator n=1 Tax=Candidatus Chloroploca mongolica TaxID=2528176 RepID=A0ABS4DG17_9CHLR|nr:metalloregulator ArsR/SmtB family transcription factor [Candidatus Chloroploca mongolica]MBP1468377.1 winged helix-turn-helix transcriptional regulator [Candidatus Chloroploca mongolica]
MSCPRRGGATVAERAGCCLPKLAPRLDAAEARRISNDLAILAHPIRLQILDLLAQYQGQVCVCDLEAALPVKQPTVSHHLKILREAGLITAERQGLWIYYSICCDTVQTMRERLLAQFALLG